ncbi:MAG TPA: hypothetical protein VF553_18715 [Pyrinomonadaceae bacterium]|jgi:hypothetical protein
MNNSRAWRIVLVLIGCIIGGVSTSAYRIGARAGAAGDAAPQDTFNLERRISSIEQRFYSIELSINRLEQQSAMGARSSPSTDRRDVEIDLLQNQLRSLQGELSEVVCGLVKLDERTLSASVRQSRSRGSSDATDPCRLSPESPLRLSTRR